LSKARDWHTYEFKVGNRVLHKGITQEPDRREREHQNNIDPDGHLKIVGRPKTEEGARQWEKDNGVA
jgi:hypothetical protein